MNAFIQDTQSHQICITVKVSPTTKEIKIYLAIEGTGPAFLRRNLGRVRRNEIWQIVQKKGPQKLKFAYNCVWIHFLTRNTDLIENIVVGNINASLIPCIPFIAKVKTGDILTMRVKKKNPTFKKLQFTPLLKKFFNSFYIDLTNTIREKVPSLNIGTTWLLLLFRKPCKIHFKHYRCYNMAAWRQIEVLYNNSFRR